MERPDGVFHTKFGTYCTFVTEYSIECCELHLTTVARSRFNNGSYVSVKAQQRLL